MTNAPETRKTHVIRILGTNKAGDVLQDIWADVERIDVAKSATQTAEGFWQGVQRKLRWMDDPDNGDEYAEEGTPSRLTEIVKLCSPDDNVDDPEEWIPIRIIKALKSRGGSAGDQSYMDRLVNDESVESRKVTVRKIVHYDTNIDDDAQAAFDSDPTRKAYVVQGENYQRDDSTKDEDQYVDHEIVEFFKPRTNERKVEGDVDRGVQTKLLNQYLIDESDAPDGAVVGSSGINPPYRLDPYQNIVNVNFLFRVYVIIVATNAFEPISGKVKVIATRSATFGRLVTVTLLECSANAGELGSLQTASDSATFGPENIRALVTPVRDEIKNRFFEIGTSLGVVGGGGFPVDSNGFPDCPWYWYARTLAITSKKMSWKIRFAAHLAGPVSVSKGGTPNKMVQCYPTSGATTGSVSLGSGLFDTVKITGYLVVAYRLDRKATGTIYNGLVTAWTSETFEFGTGDAPFSIGGLKFGTDPPLIAGDEAF